MIDAIAIQSKIGAEQKCNAHRARRASAGDRRGARGAPAGNTHRELKKPRIWRDYTTPHPFVHFTNYHRTRLFLSPLPYVQKE